MLDNMTTRVQAVINTSDCFELLQSIENSKVIAQLK